MAIQKILIPCTREAFDVMRKRISESLKLLRELRNEGGAGYEDYEDALQVFERFFGKKSVMNEVAAEYQGMSVQQLLESRNYETLLFESICDALELAIISIITLGRFTRLGVLVLFTLEAQNLVPYLQLHFVCTDEIS